MANIRDSYKHYKVNSDEPVEIKVYLDIVHGFIKFLISQLFQGEVVALPARLGTLEVIGRKVKPKLDSDGKITNLAPDWKGTKELWEVCEECKENKQIVYHFNEHTNGVRYKIHWSKNKVIVKNKILYSLVFSRANKRELNRLINSGKEYLIK